MMYLTFGAPHGKDHLVLDIEHDCGHNDRRQHRLQQRRRSYQVTVTVKNCAAPNVMAVKLKETTTDCLNSRSTSISECVVEQSVHSIH